MSQHTHHGATEDALTASQEMYLKTIYLICEEHKVARVKDIASSLDVSMSSVNGGIKGLVSRGLCEHNRYGYVDLSEEGRKIAIKVVERHHVLASFLRDVLGVSEEVALKDACEMEHVISKDTMDCMVSFSRFMTSQNGDFKNLLKAYHSSRKTAD